MTLTEEEILSLLSQLQTNMNNLDKTYYDMFYNTTPMDISLDRYDESGNIITYTVPNRAKDTQNALTGQGNPQGIQSANAGVLYLDTLNFTIYYKSSGTDAYGWVVLLSGVNFQAGRDYLLPNGNGSALTNLSANSITSGVLPLNLGGTGVTSVLALSNLILPAGIIMPYAGEIIPEGWLIADGGAYDRILYSKLYAAIGTIYGIGDGSTTFNIPDLRGEFIRGLDRGRGIDTGRLIGSAQSSAVPNITGYINSGNQWPNPTASGAFNATFLSGSNVAGNGGTGVGWWNFAFDASRSSSVYKNGVTEVRTRNIAMDYIIKY